MRCLGAGLRQTVSQHLGHFGRQELAAHAHGAHGLDQLQWVASLVGITVCTRLQAAQRVLVFRVHGDHQHLDVGVALAHAHQHFQTIASRHVDVQQQHVARGVAQYIAQFGVACGLTVDLNVGDLRQRVANAASQNGVVVANHNINQACSLF